MGAGRPYRDANAIIFNTHVFATFVTRLFAAENSVVRSRPRSRDRRRSHARRTVCTSIASLYCIVYTFSVHPFAHTHTHTQTATNQIVSAGIPPFYRRLEIVFAYLAHGRGSGVRTLHEHIPRAMRIQLRRDDFAVTSTRIFCHRERPAMHAGANSTWNNVI